MTRGRWIITTHVTGKPREIEVFLYDRVQDLRASAARFVRGWDRDAQFLDALGIVHGFTRYNDADDYSEPDSRVAIIRLARRGLTPLIVAHEVQHAVAHIYSLDHLSEGDLAADHFDSGNEDLAHLYGEIFGALWPLVAEAVEQARHEAG